MVNSCRNAIIGFGLLCVTFFVRVCEREGRRDHGAQLHFPELHQYPAHQHQLKLPFSHSLFSSPFPFFPIILSFFFSLSRFIQNFYLGRILWGRKGPSLFFYLAFARSIYSNYFFLLSFALLANLFALSLIRFHIRRQHNRWEHEKEAWKGSNGFSRVQLKPHAAPLAVIEFSIIPFPVPLSFLRLESPPVLNPAALVSAALVSAALPHSIIQ